VGYKATLLIPQNLRFASATKKVRKGRRATLKGTLALPADGTPGASVAWAPAGTLVTIQKKTGTTWVKAKTVKTGANGAWTARLRVKKTTQWRAVWPGAGSAGPETSLVKKTVGSSIRQTPPLGLRPAS
jgi:hypothetical protein